MPYVLIIILQQLSGFVRSALNLFILQLTREKQQVVTVKESVVDSMLGHRLLRASDKIVASVTLRCTA